MGCIIKTNKRSIDFVEVIRMIQLLFFITMISVAGILLYLLWFIDDSYLAELEMAEYLSYNNSCSHPHSRSGKRKINCFSLKDGSNQNQFLNTSNKVKNNNSNFTYYNKSNNAKVIMANSNNQKINNINSRVVRFIDVGTFENNELAGISEKSVDSFEFNKSDCA